jgi:hypothetical protein
MVSQAKCGLEFKVNRPSHHVLPVSGNGFPGWMEHIDEIAILARAGVRIAGDEAIGDIVAQGVW